MKRICISLAFLLVFFASAPGSLHAAHHRHRHQRALPVLLSNYPELCESSDEIINQNIKMNLARIPRIKDSKELVNFVRKGDLVHIPFQGEGYVLSDDFDLDQEFLRLAAAQYLKEFAEKFQSQFHASLKVTSLVRTEAYQQQLRHRNLNAASADGPGETLHTTGYAFDISAKEVFGRFGFIPMSREETMWLGKYFSEDLKAQRIGVAYEYKAQLDFHIVVFPQAQALR